MSQYDYDDPHAFDNWPNEEHHSDWEDIWGSPEEGEAEDDDEMEDDDQDVEHEDEDTWDTDEDEEDDEGSYCIHDSGGDLMQDANINDDRDASDFASEVLEAAVARLPEREDREGQRRMCHLVLQALTDEEDLAVRAGPLVGKTLAYGVAAAVHAITSETDKPIIIACHTRAAQDQLTSALGVLRDELLDRGFRDLRYGALKGRRNYLCVERLAELRTQPNIDEDWEPYLDDLWGWSQSTVTGDLGEHRGAIPDDLLRHICGDSCDHANIQSLPTPMPCYATIAFNRASKYDLLIANHHKYLWHLNSSNSILPDFDDIIVDEADFLLDVVADVCTRRVTINDESRKAIFDLASAVGMTQAIISDFRDVLERHAPPSNGDRTVDALRRHLQDANLERPPDLALLPTIDALIQAVRDRSVPHYMFLRESSQSLKLCATPMHPHKWLEEQRASTGTLILCSSTISSSSQVQELNSLEARHVISEPQSADVYERQALLYLPNDMPDPVTDPLVSRARALEELLALIEAAGGRTLILSTTTQDRNDIFDLLKVFEERMNIRLVRQGDLPSLRLLDRLCTDEQTVVCAVKQLWTGIDVPGDALQLVIVDKIPFAMPSRPLVWSDDSGAPVDHGDHYAERMLAQAAHRLIRTRNDRGVVALLDSRYSDNIARGRDLLALAPPMRRTSDLRETVEYLRELRDA